MDKAMGKRKRPEACSIGESHTHPRSSAGGSKERVVQERNWGDEPGDPPPRCGSRCPCPQLPQLHSALETFPPCCPDWSTDSWKSGIWALTGALISQSKGHRGKPLHTFLLGTVEAWKGPALWNQANLVSNPDSSTCYLYRFGQIT